MLSHKISNSFPLTWVFSTVACTGWGGITVKTAFWRWGLREGSGQVRNQCKNIWIKAQFTISNDYVTLQCLSHTFIYTQYLSHYSTNSLEECETWSEQKLATLKILNPSSSIKSPNEDIDCSLEINSPYYIFISLHDWQQHHPVHESTEEQGNINM